jgi:AAA15 family ATPase/GTPase
MVSIRSIKIKNFRSIKSLDLKVEKFTVLIGQNDCGKSNILRALNLFFNNETNYKSPFNFDEDFCFNVPESQKKYGIQIELVIDLPKNYHKTNGQRIVWSKKWHRTKVADQRKYHGERVTKNKHGKEKIVKINIPDKSNVHALLDQINFVYVPAVKGSQYFDSLRGGIYELISEVAAKKLKQSSQTFERSIANHLKPLTDDISKKLNINTKLTLPRDMRNVFEKLDFQSDENSISLDNRGDGVKARHIPIILNFMARQKKNLQNKGAAPHSFIWGYEEPENNVEMSRCFEMLDDFAKLVPGEIEQLFITTHSPIFSELAAEDKGCLSHVYFNHETKTTAIENDNDNLNELMGITKFISPYIKKAKEDLDKERETRRLLEEKMKNTEKSKWLYVEDQYTQIYKISWLKIKNIDFNKDNFENTFNDNSDFEVYGLKGAGAVCGALRAKNIEMFSTKRILGLFDFDKEGVEKFCSLKNDKFWGDKILGQKKTGHHRKRTDHSHFYGALLPIPQRLSTFADLEFVNFASYVEIENLLPLKIIQNNTAFTEEPLAGGSSYFKIKGDKKHNFWKKIIDLENDNFEDFLPIFNLIDNLLE